MLNLTVTKSWEHIKSAVLFHYSSNPVVTRPAAATMTALEHRGGILIYGIFTRCFCRICVTHSKVGVQCKNNSKISCEYIYAIVKVCTTKAPHCV